MIDSATKDKIEQELLGSCRSIETVLEGLQLDLDPYDTEAELDIEVCPECGWWVEPHEMVNDDGDCEGACTDCKS